MNAEQRLVESIGVDLKIEQTRIGKYDINYVTAGVGEPLVLIHGGNIGWGQWHPNLSTLTEHFKVYALDLPGAGKSTKINFKKSDLTKDFVNTVDGFIRSKNLSKVSLLGHSLGGWIALKLAAAKNSYINKIIAVNPLGLTDYVAPRYKPAALYPIAKLLSKTVLRPTTKSMEKFCTSVMYNNKENIQEEFLEYICESLSEDSKAHPLLLINRLTNFNKTVPELNLLVELPKISNKTLLIIGDKDPLTPISKIEKPLKLIPEVRVEIFSNVGHIPSIESSLRFNQLVIDFFKS